MKKLKSMLVLFNLLLLLGNNSFAATETTSVTTSYTKYIMIGVAALIIILLLFLGYKIDSRGSESNIRIKKPNAKERKEMELINEDTKYEADNVNYQNDFVNSNELVDSKEYNEDEDDDDLLSYEDKKFETFENEEKPFEEPLEETPDEDYGEAFDTSILDSLDDEDDFNAELNNELNSKKTSDDTAVFNTPPVDFLGGTDFDANSIKKEETDFSGFSSSVTDEPKNEKKGKSIKKYTKTKKVSAEDSSNNVEENVVKEKKIRKTKKIN